MDLNLSTLVPIAVSVALTLRSRGGSHHPALPDPTAVARNQGHRLTRGQLVAALRGPVVVWTTMVGVYVAAEVTTLPGATGPVMGKLLVVLLILSITWALGRAVAAAVTARAAVAMLPSVNLVSNLACILVLALGRVAGSSPASGALPLPHS